MLLPSPTPERPFPRLLRGVMPGAFSLPSLIDGLDRHGIALEDATDDELASLIRQCDVERAEYDEQNLALKAKANAIVTKRMNLELVLV